MPDTIIIRTTAPLELKADAGFDAGELTGYGATFNDEPDSFGDVIAPGAFTKSLASIARRGDAVPMLWSHRPEQPIGHWNELKEDRLGLRVRGQINLQTEAGREALAHVKAGDVRGLSIGYSVPAGGIEYGQGIQTLREIDLREISVTPVPSNRNARVTGIKSIGSQRELRDLLRESGLSRGAAAKVAAAGWPALSGDPSTNDLDQVAARLDGLARKIANLKG